MTAANQGSTYPPPQGLPTLRHSRSRRLALGLRLFIRRSPLSAFWGCVAAAIILAAVSAPLLAPYEPLKSDFRAMSKPPDERHYFGTDQIGRDVLSRGLCGSPALLISAGCSAILWSP